MLALMCEAGENRYALDTSLVVEVVSYVRLEPLAGFPEWMPGMFVYRGRAVHVVDLTQIATGGPCPPRHNSRIIVARFGMPGLPPVMGLLAERVTTAEIHPQAAEPAQDVSDLVTCGPVLLDDRGMFQLIDPARLFSRERMLELEPITAEDQG